MGHLAKSPGDYLPGDNIKLWQSLEKYIKKQM
jgi:hypothetical protein